MPNILYIAPSSLTTRKVIFDLKRITDTLVVGYNLDHITRLFTSEPPAIVIVSVSELTQSEQRIVDRVLGGRPEPTYIVIGSNDEVKEYYHKPYAKNIARYITTPTTVADIVKTIKDCVPVHLLADNTPDKYANKPDSNSGKSSGQKHILIVDDDPVFLRTMMNYLKADFRISVAKSGVSAISLLGKEKPDLILLDYEMPVMDGPTTLTMIRTEENYKDIPIIFLTGQTDPALVKQALMLHPDGYILKSSGQPVILARVKEFFAGKR